MQGAGIFTLLALLLLAPFELWQAHEQKRRSLSPHELNLRRATQPLGVVALAACGVWLFGARKVGVLLAPVLLDPAANWLPVALLAAVLLYGLASFIAGASRCWGARSDGMLPVRAFFKLAAGVAGLWFLWLGHVDLAHALDAAPGMTALRLLVVAASVWCAVVGAARLVLLTTGGGNALTRVNRHIRQTQVVMRPARRRPWWKFW